MYLDESISGKCYFIYARIIHFEFAIQIKWKFGKVKPATRYKVVSKTRKLHKRIDKKHFLQMLIKSVQLLDILKGFCCF